MNGRSGTASSTTPVGSITTRTKTGFEVCRWLGMSPFPARRIIACNESKPKHTRLQARTFSSVVYGRQRALPNRRDARYLTLSHKPPQVQRYMHTAHIHVHVHVLSVSPNGRRSQRNFGKCPPHPRVPAVPKRVAPAEDQSCLATNQRADS